MLDEIKWILYRESLRGLQLRRILCVLLFLAAIGIFPDSTSSSEIPQSDAISFGGQETILEGTCLFWGGDVSSGDFFQVLQRKDSATGPVFSKHGRKYRQYPDKLKVIIRLSQNDCDKRGVPVLGTRLISDDLASSFAFKADWKEGLHQVSCVEFTQKRFRRSSHPFTLGGQEFSDDVIQYEFSVSGRDVPLTGHLILAVSDTRGNPIVRLSAFP
jgi:hypothetical protein